MNAPLSQEWIERLGLSRRRTPELFQSADEVVGTPHAGAIRVALTELGLSAVFCVQGVPTVAFLIQEEYDRKSVIEIHAALWNQALASLLLVICSDTLRAFSLARKPLKDREGEFEDRCLVDMLSGIADALALRRLISGVESGRLWKEHSTFFPSKERIDSVLLENLSESHRSLCKDSLSSDAAQALLLQTMFIAYLEDRGIINKEYFLDATCGKANGFDALLATEDTRFLTNLFKTLRKDFNGDLFVAPCAFEPEQDMPSLDRTHLSILARFRSGKEEMHEEGGQYRFWGYDFRYIPVELISAVYDRFLGERDDERRQQGAYYTPMFLADMVVSQVWDLMPPAIRDKGTFLDPACGSGVFLVRLFQRLCEHWRATRKSKTIRWDSLLATLDRMHGWDINGSSVRVAVFSLYIALLEQVSPPDIRLLIGRGRILPELWRRTLIKRDFFQVPDGKPSYEIIIGNPPWRSRKGLNRNSVRWCSEHRLPMPGNEDAWAFTWKALTHVKSHGLVAFLLPAMGFLHNHSSKTVAARNLLIRTNRIQRIINFADLRFQLFESAIRPATLLILGKQASSDGPYRFEYWTPKADLNLRVKRFITLTSIDKSLLRSDEVVGDDLAFKRRLWMRVPDAKLFSYLSAFPRLRDFIKVYGDLNRRRQATDHGWVIGQGFKQAISERLSDETYDVTESEFVGRFPFLPIEAFQKLVLSSKNLKPWHTNLVHRRGFEEGFIGTRILIPRGVETAQMRLRASYSEQNLTFFHIIQAITVPQGDETTAKLLTALLNSRVAVWFAFHGTASFGSDRPEVQQAELLRLPFPNADDLPEPERAKKAARKLVRVIDDLASISKNILSRDDQERTVLSEIDTLSYEYFCLSEGEVAIIEDTVDYIMPAVQPHQGSMPDIWKSATLRDREAYASMLVGSLDEWLDEGWTVNSSLDARNADIGILRLRLTPSRNAQPYRERTDNSLDQVLKRLWKNVQEPLSGNFQLVPDFRIFAEGDLYLVKPMQKRFWLRSTALADADSIAADLQDALAFGKMQDHA